MKDIDRIFSGSYWDGVSVLFTAFHNTIIKISLSYESVYIKTSNYLSFLYQALSGLLLEYTEVYH